MEKIIVHETDISIAHIHDEDYICLTDMLKAKNGDFFNNDWQRNRNTLENIGIWEKVYNPDFNYGEFAIIKSQSGLNSFKISVKEFVAKTNAISIQAKASRCGGTYVHKDIAFEFCYVDKSRIQNLHCQRIPETESRGTAAIRLERQKRTGKDQLPHTH